MFPVYVSFHSLFSLLQYTIVKVWYSIHINLLTNLHLIMISALKLYLHWLQNQVYFLSSVFNFSLHHPEVNITRPLTFWTTSCVGQLFFSIPKPVHNNTWYKRYSCSDANPNSITFTFNVYFYYLDLDLTSTLGFRLRI